MFQIILELLIAAGLIYGLTWLVCKLWNSLTLRERKDELKTLKQEVEIVHKLKKQYKNTEEMRKEVEEFKSKESGGKNE